MDAAYEFSEFIAQTRFEDFPKDAIHIAKKEVLDVIAVGLSGTTADGVGELYDLVREWGGREESTIMGLGGRVPSPNAAFVNSVMAHALDFDDTFTPGIVHPGTVVVPSAFAISEARGGVNGKEFITAICVATEMGCRLGRATISTRPNILMGGWDYTSLVGYFEAASMTKLLNLDKEKIHNALGLAYMQAAGNQQALYDGALAHRMGAGFAARGGLTSALMAQRGITAAKRIFDEDDGIASYYTLYHGGCKRKVLLGGLGKYFTMEGMAFKPYAGCKLLHAPIDAMLKLIKENHIKIGEIREITAFVAPVAEVTCRPENRKKKPKTVVDAQFSIPWGIACAAVRGNALIGEFTEEAIRDHALLEIAAKVKTVIGSSTPPPGYAKKYARGEYVKLEVKTGRGEFNTVVVHPYGTPENPMSFEDIGRKLMDCASYSLKPIPEQNIKTVVNMVSNLEEVKDVADIIRLVG